MSRITTYSWARPKAWNTGSAAERFRHNRKKILESRKKLQAASVKPEDLHAANTLSFKHQAPSATKKT